MSFAMNSMDLFLVDRRQLIWRYTTVSLQLHWMRVFKSTLSTASFGKPLIRLIVCILHLNLASTGINGSLLAWLASYLEGRVQVIKVQDRLSDSVNVTSGVPQGSHLGPLLFVLFINDHREVFQHSRFLMYADDLKIFRTISGASDVNLLQADLTRFEQWCTVNRMRLNTGKRLLLRTHRAVSGIPSIYILCDTTLSEVAEVVDLGVTFTKCLDFRNQYRKITCKAMKTPWVYRPFW